MRLGESSSIRMRARIRNSAIKPKPPDATLNAFDNDLLVSEEPLMAIDKAINTNGKIIISNKSLVI